LANMRHRMIIIEAVSSLFWQHGTTLYTKEEKRYGSELLLTWLKLIWLNTQYLLVVAMSTKKFRYTIQCPIPFWH
ncbi:7881_t:CDS:2, partial [Rhizophagus irregularis]